MATVTQNGVGRTGQGDKAVLGETTITAAMHRASHNYGSARILLVPVTGLVLLDGVLEAEVGSGLPLAVSLLGSSDGEDVKITQCCKLQLDINLTGAVAATKPSMNYCYYGVFCRWQNL